MLAFPSVTHSMFLFFIGYVGYHQNFTVADFKRDVDDYKNKKFKGIEQDKVSSTQKITKNKLDRLMLKKELFKNPDLRITDIALMLGTNRTYISRLVNEETHTNFCEWVNEFRINYAKKLMKNPEYNNLSLLQIGEMSGFSSASAFYRVFKEKEGSTPGNFREEK